MIKDLILLHNNDLHNSLFFKTDENFILHGGISMLADYIKTERQRNDNILYTISGDILQEDISGSDYKGINTVDIINGIAPDAISLGNHELDYGLAHLLIFKECIKSPILNANIIVDNFHQNLFIPSKIFKAGNIKILTIGLIPETFFNKILSDPFCKNMLSYKDSYEAIRTEINKYSPDEYDMVMLLSHYGLEGDIYLAKNMPQDIRINLILGGHDHIDMEKAEVVNNIIIAQSSFGTTHVGRFDIKLDTDEKTIKSYEWKRIEINSTFCNFEESLDNLTDKYIFNKKKITKRLVCKFAEEYKNESRLYETQVGDIIADVFKTIYKPDFVILQSGSLRKKSCPIDFTEHDLIELYPFDDYFGIVEIDGKTIKEMFRYLFKVKSDGNIMNGTFQYSDGFNLIVESSGYKERGYLSIEKFTLNGQTLEDTKSYKVGITKNCFANFKKYFDIEIPEEKFKILSFSTYNDLATYLLNHEKPITAPVLGNRFIIKNWK